MSARIHAIGNIDYFRSRFACSSISYLRSTLFYLRRFNGQSAGKSIKVMRHLWSHLSETFFNNFLLMFTTNTRLKLAKKAIRHFSTIDRTTYRRFSHGDIEFGALGSKARMCQNYAVSYVPDLLETPSDFFAFEVLIFYMCD